MISTENNVGFSLRIKTHAITVYARKQKPKLRKPSDDGLAITTQCVIVSSVTELTETDIQVSRER